ncbi:hypothetical protein [Bernardetia litoralis]|uniref:hypothetical protein n=1 Tax=Bernardetia litoralis TaxID=999 RepID=UPI00031FBCDB|nr:hypothetical protein [Bernardetia litoralis]
MQTTFPAFPSIGSQTNSFSNNIHSEEESFCQSFSCCKKDKCCKKYKKKGTHCKKCPKI